MRKLQTDRLHDIMLVGADRRTSIDFWEGLLGMPFVFEQVVGERVPRSRDERLDRVSEVLLAEVVVVALDWILCASRSTPAWV
jgi:hypothetical protein